MTVALRGAGRRRGPPDLPGARRPARRVVLRSALALYASTLLTSGLGFPFWWVAARRWDAHAVGSAAALLSALQLVTTVCVLGLGTLVIGEVRRAPASARSLVATAAATAVVTSAAAAAVGALALRAAGGQLADGLRSPLALAALGLITLAAGAAVVLDAAAVGLGRSGVQLERNAVLAVGKLVVLVALGGTAWRSTGSLLAAWAVPLAASAALAWRRLARLLPAGYGAVDLRLLRHHAPAIAAHHWLGASAQASRHLIPVCVAMIVSPERTAAFATATLLVGFVNVVPSHLATALFALAPGDEEGLRREVRTGLRLCVLLAACSAPAFAFAGPPVLGLFGSEYRVAGGALALLGLTTLPQAVQSHYLAVMRVRGRMAHAAARTTAGAALEVLGASVGAARGGLAGAALGLLLVDCLEQAVFLPPIWRLLHPRRRTSAGKDT